MKYFGLLLQLFLWGICTPMMSQEVKVKSLETLENDKTAQNQPRKDLNKMPCALVKLKFGDTITRVEGNVIGDVIDKGDEKWIYLTDGTKEMKVVPKNYVPFFIVFSQYGVRSVSGGKTYLLSVETPTNDVTTEMEAYPHKDIESFTVEGITFKMVRVKGGEFTMGATAEQEKYAKPTEKPAHQVVLSDYYMATTEVTQELWEKIMGNNPSPVTGAKMPVQGVKYDDCEQFTEILSNKLGLPFRIPTEAEWEYAARGGEKSKKYVFSGSNKIDEVGWYSNNSNKKPHEVGTKKPNELGLYDMSGNVWEVVEDFDGEYPSMKLYNPLMLKWDDHHMARGGAYDQVLEDTRTTHRVIVHSSRPPMTMGMRLALDGFDVKEKEAAMEKLINSPADCKESQTSKGVQFTIDGVTFNMIKVDGGTFKMGATKEQVKPSDAEKPVHPVTVSDYYISETEVTQELFKTIIQKCPFTFFGDQLPAENLSKKNITYFLRRLSNITGWNFRLPTEAEWEFAARGGNKSQGYMYAGSNNYEEVMWWYGNTKSVNRPVAKKKPNELGIYDMSGNVSEHCSDYFGEYKKSKIPVENPQGPESGKYHVLRGGDCSLSPWYSRVSMRLKDHLIGYNAGQTCGLRLVMDHKK